MMNIHCPDCDVNMEIGYIPDRGHSIVVQMEWNSGKPEPSKIFGMKTGSVKPSDGGSPLPILAFRCPNCGLLRLHAIPEPDEPSK